MTDEERREIEAMADRIRDALVLGFRVRPNLSPVLVVVDPVRVDA